MKRIAMALLACGLLAACADPPTADQVTTALNTVTQNSAGNSGPTPSNAANTTNGTSPNSVGTQQPSQSGTGGSNLTPPASNTGSNTGSNSSGSSSTSTPNNSQASISGTQISIQLPDSSSAISYVNGVPVTK